LDRRETGKYLPKKNSREETSERAQGRKGSGDVEDRPQGEIGDAKGGESEKKKYQHAERLNGGKENSILFYIWRAFLEGGRGYFGVTRGGGSGRAYSRGSRDLSNA